MNLIHSTESFRKAQNRYNILYEESQTRTLREEEVAEMGQLRLMIKAWMNAHAEEFDSLPDSSI